jgi:hypothetical protein
MAKIHGTYEYNDDLTPGKKKEGGLHQNLFDSDGNLKGSARFIPDEDQAGEDYDSTYVDAPYVDPYYAAQLAAEAEAEERRREREREENAELIAKVLTVLATVAYVKAKPHAQRLWREKVSPAIRARREARALRKSERQERRAKKRVDSSSESTQVAPVVDAEVVVGTVVEPTNDLVIASQEYRRNMSSSEAQARYLMALAAKAFSDEQLRLVAKANIVEDDEFGELERALAELPPGQVANFIDQLELNPSVIADQGFDLAKFLEEAAEQLPIDRQSDG